MRLLAIAIILILLFGCAIPGSNSGGKTNTQTQPPVQPPAQTQPQANTQPPANSQPPATTPPVDNAPPASVLPSQEISYDASGWTIYGTLYSSQDKTPTKLILLIPGLGTTRDSYPQDFIVSLHDSIPDALILAIDHKGVGKSTNLGSWRDFDQSAFLDMRTDIISAKPYIVKLYPAVKEIYVVGASMGSTSALMAAVKEKSITKVAMISPGVAFNNIDITKSGGIESYMQPLLVVASSGDAYSATSAAEIRSLTSESQTTYKIYAGSAHGTDLFESTKGDDTPVSVLLINFLKG